MTPSQAHLEVSKAVRAGKLIRLNKCELCGIEGRTVGHHYNGWNKPLDVWFICYSCNTSLRGYHDGSLTKEQAREIINQIYLSRRWRVIECYRQNPERWRVAFQGTESQALKRYHGKITKRWGRKIALMNPAGEVIKKSISGVEIEP